MAQPHRGDRVLLGTRVPEPLAQAVRVAAREANFRSVSDYVAALLAAELDFPYSAPMAHADGQEALEVAM